MSVPEPSLTKGTTSGRPVYFIADSHLGIESDEVERVKSAGLVSLLEALRSRAGHVYLVGDVFDFWFEYPYPTEAGHAPVLAALRTLSDSGTLVHFTGGNHDYWAGRQLAGLTGAAVHREPVEVSHFGRRLFIAHGDGLPRGDWGYRILKSIIRNPIAIAGFSLIPPRAGAAVARWASGLSTVTEDRVERALPPMLAFIRQKLAEGFDGVVVAHVHRQVVREWPSGTGVVVGDWMSNRSVVELGPAGFRALTWSGGELREMSAD